MGAYILNLDDNESIGTYRRALYVDDKNVKHFDSFGVEHVPKEIRKFIIHNLWILCIGFIDFRLKDKSLLEFKNLFSPNEYKTNDKVIKTFFAKRILKT